LAGLKAGEAEAAIIGGLEALARGRQAPMMQIAVGVAGAQAEAKAGLLIHLMQAEAARLALTASAVEPAGAAWRGALAGRAGAGGWAGAYAAISAISQQWDGLDMDAGLAVSRAAAVLIETAAG
jgi:hypothetical protein